ncbi:Ubiquinone biosynthesis protein [Ascosphaera pollenicola]|nr:Ubiquinone biosynthesis protein [Ascosphaera pollenicola]
MRSLSTLLLATLGGLAAATDTTNEAPKPDAPLSHSAFSSSVHERSRDTSNSTEDIYATRLEFTTWDQANWRLRTTKLDQGHYQSRPAVANGYVGLSVAAVGPFFDTDVPVNGDASSGWPLSTRRQTFGTVAGFYDLQPTIAGTNFPWLNQYGSESIISGIPHWSGILIDLNDGKNILNGTVDPKTISNFTSTYDFKRGIVDWKYTWKPHQQDTTFLVEYQLFAHRLAANVAVSRLSITPTHDSKVTIANAIDGAGAVRTANGKTGEDGESIYSTVSPIGMPNVTAALYAIMEYPDNLTTSNRTIHHGRPYVFANDSSIAESWTVKLAAKKTASFTKYIGVASSDAFADPKKVARKAAMDSRKMGYESLLRTHEREWRDTFPDDSVDDFTDPNTGRLPDNDDLVEAAIMAVVNPYYILQNTVTKNARKAVNGAVIDKYSISVGGLTSDAYGGMIFWDSDIWMQPGFVAAFPESARTLSNYRVATYRQALANAQTAYTSSKNKTYILPKSAFYPWTSGRFGNCTGSGPCFDYEYHLNGDIGLELINDWVTTGDDDYFNHTLLPMYESIATGYASIVEKNGSTWTLTNMTDPDEYANHVNGGAYTMAMIGSTLRTANTLRKLFNRKQNETWNEIADHIYIARDVESDITMEYNTMNGSVFVKQADVVLLPYPLGYTYHYSPERAMRDLDYSPDGPGMTYAIFSIGTNDIAPSGCAGYTYDKYSYQPYIRAPWFQFSEQMIDDASVNGGTHPAFPFLTGHGGANQVNLFGYLGYRQIPDMALHIQPNIPPQIPHIAFRTFYWRGWPIKAESNYTHTILHRSADKKPLDHADREFANRSITVQVGSQNNASTYSLPVNGSIIVQNRQTGSVATTPGDMVQCQPASSSSSTVPGQFPISAVDGMSSTKWQPVDASVLSALTVELRDSDVGSYTRGFHFNWADSPPRTASVMLHDEPFNMIETRNETHAPHVPKMPGSFVALDAKNITISHPYDPKEENIIRIYQGNVTNVTLPEPVQAKRLATLFIWGNQALSTEETKARNSSGATVANFVILKDQSEN